MNDLTDLDSSLVEVKRAAEHIITHFRVPLESKGVILATIQDEIEEIVDYGRKYLDINKLDYREAWYTSFCHVQMLKNGQMLQVFVNWLLVFHFQMVGLSKFFHP